MGGLANNKHELHRRNCCFCQRVWRELQPCLGAWAYREAHNAAGAKPQITTALAAGGCKLPRIAAEHCGGPHGLSRRQAFPLLATVEAIMLDRRLPAVN